MSLAGSPVIQNSADSSEPGNLLSLRLDKHVRIVNVLISYGLLLSSFLTSTNHTHYYVFPGGQKTV